MTKNKTPADKNTPAANDARADRTLRWVMVALAGGLVAVGAMVVLKSKTSDTAAPANPSQQTLTDSQRVQAQVRELLKAGRHVEAMKSLAEHIRAHPDDVDAQVLLAQSLSDLGDYAQAEHVVDDIFRGQQSLLRARLWWLKGELVRRRDSDPAKSMTFFASAVDQPDATPDIWSKYGQLLERSDPQAAREWCQRALDAGLRDAETLRVLGGAALDHDELDRARTLLEEAVETEKNNPELWLLLVQTLRAMGSDDQALATAQTALQGRPGGELWLELAQLLEARGETVRVADADVSAADAYAEAAGYRLVAPEASLAAARLFYAQGQHARAMRYIDQARLLWGDDPAVVTLQKKIEDARFVAK